MDDVQDYLNRGVGDYEPSADDALDATIRRAEGRARRRHVLTGLATFGLTTGLIGALWWTFLPAPVSRPITGPTLSPTPASPLAPKTGCYQSFRDEIPRCISRDGPIVRMATGHGQASSWTLLGFRASYNGPAPGVRAGVGPPVTRPMICTSWTPAGRTPEFSCETVFRANGIGVFMVQFGGSLRTGVPEPPWSRRVARGDPLEGLGEGPGFVSGLNTETHHVLWGWTSPRTEEVSATPQGKLARSVPIFGPFPQLGTNVRWFVAFSPVDVPVTVLTALDSSGALIWEEREHVVVPVQVVKGGDGSGSVLGYESPIAECVGCRPARPRIDCGETCSTEVLPGFELTLEARPAPGSRFVRWEGACLGTQPSCTVTIQRGTYVTAIFEST